MVRGARPGLVALVLGLIAAPGSGRAAPSPASQPELAPPPVEDQGGRALAGFRARLEGLRRGTTQRVRITHFGDSHVTSDVPTGLLRELLQREYGDGGPGFVLLGKPWPTYRHDQVKTGADPGWVAERLWTHYGRGRFAPRDDRFGLAGISVHAVAPTRTWLALRSPTSQLSSAELFFLRQPEGGRLEVFVGDRRLRWFFLASSESEAEEARIPLPPGTRQLELRASLGEVRLFGVDLAGRARGVVYDALGLNGARAGTQLSWNEPLMTRQLRRLAPDLVIIAYGSNEVDNERLTRASFAVTFDEVLQRLRRMVPAASCLVLGPPDRGRFRRRRGWEIPESLSFIIEEQRRLAALRGCAFWDQREAMGGPGSIQSWLRLSPPLADRDRVHLTGAGYRRLARALHRALLPQSPAASSAPRRSTGFPR